MSWKSSRALKKIISWYKKSRCKEKKLNKKNEAICKIFGIIQVKYKKKTKQGLKLKEVSTERSNEPNPSSKKAITNLLEITYDDKESRIAKKGGNDSAHAELLTFHDWKTYQLCYYLLFPRIVFSWLHIHNVACAGWDRRKIIVITLLYSARQKKKTLPWTIHI